MPDENTKLHKKLIKYKRVIEKWDKENAKPEGSKSLSSFSNRPPFLAGAISNETLTGGSSYISCAILSD
jgi:hypothetical protein